MTDEERRTLAPFCNRATDGVRIALKENLHSSFLIMRPFVERVDWITERQPLLEAA